MRRDWNIGKKLVNNEASGAEAAYGFIFSNECISQNLSNEAFVDLLYRALFGREPDAEGRTGWINQLNNGMKREFVFADFVNSEEFETICNTYKIEKGKCTGGDIFCCGNKCGPIWRTYKAGIRNGM